MSRFNTGTIVHYKQDYWVVLKSKWNDANLRIIRPHVGNEKREIGSHKARKLDKMCTVVNVNGKDIIVTPKGFLISMVSERLLKNTTKEAKQALAMAGL